MAIHRLRPAALNRKTPGRYPDGGGLVLQISEAKDGGINRSWIFRYAVADTTKPAGYRNREMGLGSCSTVGLGEARELARQCRLQRLAGIDPIEQRNAERAAKVTATVRVMTFDQCAAAYQAAHRGKWRSKRHAAQWAVSLAKDASPIIGKLPVAVIDTALVMKVLQPIWSAKPKTASRLRGRIERILDWATVSGFRTGDNPARWAGHLEYLLASPRALKPVKSFTAIDYRALPALLAELRAREGMTERALEFLILTAARSGEVLGAQWPEIDVGGRVWTVPAGRMKANREHRVPLTDRCIAILREAGDLRQSDFVFPSARNEAANAHVMRKLLLRMGHNGFTVHGMRAAFKTWASECTAFPPELAEHALAHVVGSDVERRYKRNDLFDRRRRLMDAWAAFCAKPLAAKSERGVRAVKDGPMKDRQLTWRWHPPANG